MPEPDMQHMLSVQRDKRLDQFSRFLLPTKPEGLDDEYYNERKQMMGKELSVANLEWEHMRSFVRMFDCGEEFLLVNQEITARYILNKLIMELKLSMSKDGMFIDKLLSNRIEYSQTQNVHEYTHQPEKRGLFGGQKKPPGA